ncbi:RING finger and transmembrane domain-containing protein [Cryptosporidium canis]|uniref:RING finger and transmembrane domain-containing protein n=1 Tax=Cryptosporidium canis TaxID=195482 RepID=A0ABQ8P3R0_9CRYT|nr:RING finger and transmembrane domain-containing protein [Cryptosporidium canis]KAJ1615186.1 RING finger and transmembrane domain-containing protein [Cryptosporidium canis]
MLVKERINIWCRKYLNIQPLFRTQENVIISSSVAESSLRNIYGRTSSDATLSSPEYASRTHISSNIPNSNNLSHQENASEDSLMQLVCNYPEKTIWFLSCNLLIGIVSFLSLGFITTGVVLRNWRSNFENSPFLSVWLLVHGCLQIIQGLFRCYYKFILEKERPNSTNARVIQILQTVRRLTTNRAWKIGKIFSLIYYIWFVFGFYWILSVRPSAETLSYRPEELMSNLSESQMEDHSLIADHRSYLLLGNNSFYSMNNLIKVDFSSGLWSLYLIVMLICTFRIISMVSFFYFIFPTIISSEYTDNKLRACTINRLESLPVKPYSEWKKLKEDESACNKHSFLQDNCIICLNDFSSFEMARCLPCNHVFHEDCIDLWLLRNAVCPLCQTSIK